MKIIEYESHFWFLLTNGNEYFIDVNCNNSFMGFNRTIKLDEFEKTEYLNKGKEYLAILANDIQFYSSLKYKERSISKEVEEQIYKSIVNFNNKNSP